MPVLSEKKLHSIKISLALLGRIEHRCIKNRRGKISGHPIRYYLEALQKRRSKKTLRKTEMKLAKMREKVNVTSCRIRCRVVT